MAAEPSVPGPDSLDAQLDALLSGASAAPRDDKPEPRRPTAAPDAASDNLLTQQISDLLAQGAAHTGDGDEPMGDMLGVEELESDDLVGDDLANQIQSLLDDARAQEISQANTTPTGGTSAGAADPAPAQAAPPQAAEPQEVDVHGLAGEMLCPEELLSPDEVGARERNGKSEAVVIDSAPSAVDSDRLNSRASSMRSGSDATDINDIDAMLAEHADDAIYGEFESVQDVLNPADAAPASPSPGPAAASTRGASGFTADARAVAHELDSDPQHRVTDHAAHPSAGNRDGAMHAPAAASTAGRRARKLQVASRARLLCAILNRPMDRFSPETRSLIGRVGLLTLFNATGLFLYTVVRTLMT